MADDLTPFVDQADSSNAQRAHDDDPAIIVAAVRRRPTRKPGVRCLHDDDLVCRDTGFEHSPLLNEVAGPNDCQDWTVSESEALTVAKCAFGSGQHMARTDN